MYNLFLGALLVALATWYDTITREKGDTEVLKAIDTSTGVRQNTPGSQAEAERSSITERNIELENNTIQRRPEVKRWPTV